MDGSGRPGYLADVVVDRGSIALVGDASEIESARTWDASGRVVSPGFIDIHSHADFPSTSTDSPRAASGRGSQPR